jgi:hypothetical protein
MRLPPAQPQSLTCLRRGRRDEHGLSLMEMAVAMGVSSLILVIIGLLSLSGLRSFLVMGNCAALDQRNRLLSDQLSRDLREASKVVRFQTDTDGTTLVLTNTVASISVSYVWDREARTVTCTKTDQSPVIGLKDCDSWEVQFFQNLPQPSASEPFLPVASTVGVPDLGQARIVTLSWKCSRPVAGTGWNTESTQTVQVALRNFPPP